MKRIRDSFINDQLNLYYLWFYQPTSRLSSLNYIHKLTYRSMFYDCYFMCFTHLNHLENNWDNWFSPKEEQLKSHYYKLSKVFINIYYHPPPHTKTCLFMFIICFRDSFGLPFDVQWPVVCFLKYSADEAACRSTGSTPPLTAAQESKCHHRLILSRECMSNIQIFILWNDITLRVSVYPKFDS